MAVGFNSAFKRLRKEGTGRRGRRRKLLLDGINGNEKILCIEIGSTRSHFLENSVSKSLWSFRKAGCVVVVVVVELLLLLLLLWLMMMMMMISTTTCICSCGSGT